MKVSERLLKARWIDEGMYEGLIVGCEGYMNGSKELI